MSYEIDGARLSQALGSRGGNALPSLSRNGNQAGNTMRDLKSDDLERGRELDGQDRQALADRAAKELQNIQTLFRPELEFKVDDVSGRTVITVYNPETEEVIRQIPPEEAVRLAHLLQELGSNGDLSEISLIRTRA
ncbi:flagellar protein FlaG [Gammaproteobacteria bacterium AB-CW1]|uniref:Flagellar protein FlaG n=1 Tax=Natronospira elongata TaxID=3110268 RepID=A0AAP6JD80_9GAMM|nr:flagellar protein FlaG [Gammaproteobacteria bacterium AB-CW1]